MKKLFLLSVFCCCVVCADAQKNYLTDVKEIYDYESLSYRYNDKDLIDSVGIISLDFYPHYDLFDYNEFGKVVKVTGYDDIGATGVYSMNSYIDYEYNDKNQMTARLNYNDFGEGPQLNGRLSYSYDDAGRLSKIVYEFYYGGTYDKFMEDTYIYDDKGRIDYIETYQDDFYSGGFILSKKQVYAYKDNSDDVVVYQGISGNRWRNVGSEQA